MPKQTFHPLVQDMLELASLATFLAMIALVGRAMGAA